jgi:hypothetical protein
MESPPDDKPGGDFLFSFRHGSAHRRIHHKKAAEAETPAARNGLETQRKDL